MLHENPSPNDHRSTFGDIADGIAPSCDIAHHGGIALTNTPASASIAVVPLTGLQNAIETYRAVHP